MTETVRLLAAAVLIGGNAYFVAAEFALVSVRRSQIEPLAESGDRRAHTVLRSLEKVSVMLAATQLGVTVCSLLFAALAEPTLSRLIETPLHAAGLPEVLNRPIGYALALVVAVSLHMVLGEMVPKNLTLTSPERVVLWLGPSLAALSRALGPVIHVLDFSANAVLGLFRVQPRQEVASVTTNEELVRLVEDSSQAGLLGAAEKERLEDALQLGHRPVTDVLLHRDDVVFLPPDVTAAQLEETSVRTGYSRFPVRGTTERGDIRGYLHVKDALETEDRNVAIPTRLWRPLPVVQDSTRLDDALTGMRRTASHLAAVVDSARRPLGLVMLEDVLEELVGELSDPAQRR